MDSLSSKLYAAFHSELHADSEFGENTAYFVAGLTSLQLLRISERLVADGVKVTLNDLFRYPTVGDLAAELRRRGNAPADTGLPWES
ncbi:phosphopantetheine-binding protein [Streptomyces sp. NPDC059104]|uniref:phosphopantetheine-binding protein n=1 Tax=Streptomyces sp. NPDC059104 TaxID=3346729 RepID=UPI0036C5B789